MTDLRAPDLFVIQNPAAGPKHAERLRRRIEAALAERQIAYRYSLTRAPGHARELAIEALNDGFERVLVAGGDGTVLEAVSGLVHSDAALALLPVGTGNQLAANLGIPRSIVGSLDVATAGVARRIDVGIIDGQPFTCIAGVGFDAEVVNPPRDMKKRLGYLAYIHAAAAAAFAPRPSVLRVTVDDGVPIVCTGIGVEVANMPGLTAPLLRTPVDLIPDGRPDDGLLDVCVLAVETLPEFVAAIGSIVSGGHKEDSRLRYYRGRTIGIDADPPMPMQIDGERLERTTPFSATVMPGALNVIVPGTRSA